MIKQITALRALLAVAFTLVLVFLSMQTFKLSVLVTLNMMLVMHAVYYWAVFRPSVLPAWFAFLLGFVVDLVSGRLLGFYAFLMVFASYAIGRQRRYLLSQPFATQWAVFLFVSFSAELFHWVVMAVVSLASLSPVSALVSALMSAALYPVTSLIMLGCLKVVASERVHEGLS